MTDRMEWSHAAGQLKKAGWFMNYSSVGPGKQRSVTIVHHRPHVGEYYRYQRLSIKVDNDGMIQTETVGKFVELGNSACGEWTEPTKGDHDWFFYD